MVTKNEKYIANYCDDDDDDDDAFSSKQ